jgi:hypothetical protein
MSYQHQSLASGRWRSLSLIEQLANIGSEVKATPSGGNISMPLDMQHGQE